MSITFRHPLEWPEGWPRNNYRVDSRFKVDQDQAVDEMELEIERLGGSLIVLTSELVLRRDGKPAKNQRVLDPGVAVYFQREGQSECIAIDKYLWPEDNIRAIGKTIEAMRGIERWGGSEILNKAFEGFRALPSGHREWWEVLQVAPTATNQEIREARNRLAQYYHPDKGNDPAGHMMAQINRAYDLAMGTDR